MEPGRGVVYLAIGHRYLAEATISAASVRRHHELPITIFTDQPDAARAVGLFESVLPIAQSGRTAHRDKLLAMAASPYPQTLFLDTDTYVGADLTDCFGLLDRFDFAAAGDRGFTDRFPEENPIPHSFKEHNLGVLFFRQSPQMAAVLADAQRILDRLVRHRPAERWRHYDQPAFRVAVYHRGARFCPLPPEDNCRFVNHGALTGPVRVLHGRSPRAAHTAANLERILRRLNQDTGPRVFVAGRAWSLRPATWPVLHHYRAHPRGRFDRPDPSGLRATAARRIGVSQEAKS